MYNVSGKLAHFIVIAFIMLIAAACSSDYTQKEAASEAKPSITVGIYDRGSIPEGEGTIDNNRWTHWINEHSPVNVKFVPIPRGESVQKYKVLFASGHAPDLILDFDSSFLAQLIVDDQVIPIDELVEQHSTIYKQLLEQYPLVRRLTTEPDGKMYLIAQITGLKTNHSLLIRQDWLDVLGLEMPKNEQDLLQVVRAFTFDDPDRNGIDDTYGINFTGLGSLLNGKVAGGIRPLDMMFRNVGYILQDEKVIRAWKQAEAALDYAKQLYNEGAIDPNFLTDKDGEKAKLDFVSGKLGIFWVCARHGR